MIRAYYTLVLTSAFALNFACGTPASENELTLDEAAAYLSVSDETDGDPAADAVAGMEEAIDGLADEEVDGMPEVEPPEAFDRCDRSARRARIRQAFDENGDGQLDDTERQALRADLAERDRAPRLARLTRRVRHRVIQRIRWAFDADNNGELDRTERASFIDAIESRCQARRARILEAFDADGDGTLSETERDAARQAHRARMQTIRQNILDTFDVNEDGTLDRRERQARRNAVRARLRARAQRVRDHFDADGDGQLSPEEIDALKAAIRDRVALAQDDSVTDEG